MLRALLPVASIRVHHAYGLEGRRRLGRRAAGGPLHARSREARVLAPAKAAGDHRGRVRTRDRRPGGRVAPQLTYRCDILVRGMELSPTARVLLGMIRKGGRTGYEIKQLVDISTRFFWAASYGQIYPELRRLEEAGLIEGEDDPAGGRRRRAYSLTAEGESALDEWLRSGDEPTYELRDEGLLKLFFSDRLGKQGQLALIRGIRARHEAVIERLRTVEAAAAEAGGGAPRGRPSGGGRG